MGTKFSVVAPKARLGDTVEVLNYRLRPARWVQGEVLGVSLEERWKRGFEWSYEVGVTSPNLSQSRRSYRRGTEVFYRLGVSGNAIKLLRSATDKDGA